MKILKLSCGPQVARLLSRAIRVYAEQAFPAQCATDCDQVARAALLDAAKTLEDQVASGEHRFVLNRRARVIYEAAVAVYFHGAALVVRHGLDEQRELVLCALAGAVVSDGDLVRAIEQDGGSAEGLW